MADVATRSDQQTSGLLAAGVAVTVWGASGVVARQLSMTAPAIAAYRFGMYFIALVVWLGVRRTPMTRRALRTAMPGGLWLAVDVLLFFYAVKHTTISNATLIGALQPVLIMAVSIPLFGERPSRRDVVAALVAIGGVAAVVVIAAGQPTWSGLGDLAAAGAMVSWGAYFVMSRRAQERLSSTEFTAGASFWAAIIAVPVGLLAGQDLSWPVADDWPLLLFMTFGVGLFGSSLMNWSIGRLELWLASTMTLIIPIASALLAWWILDEPITGPQAAAMGVVLGALAVIVLGQSGGAAVGGAAEDGAEPGPAAAAHAHGDPARRP